MSATSLFLTDRVVVGVITVDGPTAPLQFTDDERTLVHAQVLKGTDFLAGIEPRANVQFSYVWHHVSITLTDDGSRKDDVWIRAVLRALGANGESDLVADLIKTSGAKWGFVAYFTKYQHWHFAYQVGQRIVMEFTNDGWGSNSIERVFAHEVGHVFGAADEYGGCNCNASGNMPGPTAAAPPGVENLNCVNFGKNVQFIPPVLCIMNYNIYQMCSWTRGQLGWGYFKLRNYLPPPPPPLNFNAGDFDPLDEIFPPTPPPPPLLKQFAGWASLAGVTPIAGDFNGDGLTDIALLPTSPTSDWTTIPVAFSVGDGTFNIVNVPASSADTSGHDFLSQLRKPGVKVIARRFLEDRTKDDLVAYFEQGSISTSYASYDQSSSNFSVSGEQNDWASYGGPFRMLPGHFREAGLCDFVALPALGSTESTSLMYTYGYVGSASRFAMSGSFLDRISKAIAIVGDFDGDGLDDIALIATGNDPGWTTIAVALSQSDVTNPFKFVDFDAPGFTSAACQPGAVALAGDFDGNGQTDIALVYMQANKLMSTVALSNGDGSFRIITSPISGNDWSIDKDTFISVGDFNGDGKADILMFRRGSADRALRGIGIAFSNGDGTFTNSVVDVGNFQQWSFETSKPALVGKFLNESPLGVGLCGGPVWSSIPTVSYMPGVYERKSNQ